MVDQYPRVIFFGTPEFASYCLETLIEEGVNIVAAVTAPDRPAGRGHKLRQSAVKEVALKHDLDVWQPENLKSPEFVAQLEKAAPDVGIVVAFRMLPEVVWDAPKLGTFNLHASLLPNYRGAAPINWAIINGEEMSGVTTFLLDKKIDTGQVLMQESEPITDSDSAGTLHDKLMHRGSRVIIETLHRLSKGDIEPIPQHKLVSGKEKDAPKIDKRDCTIDWSKSNREVYNLIRGMSPYPTARTTVSIDGEKKLMKIYQSNLGSTSGTPATTNITSDQKIEVCCGEGSIVLQSIQLEGRKRMEVSDFLKANFNSITFDV